MINIDVKNFTCEPNGCGCIFTIPKEWNSIHNEFAELGLPYLYAVIKENDIYIVLSCPKCNKEVYRVRK